MSAPAPATLDSFAARSEDISQAPAGHMTHIDRSKSLQPKAGHAFFHLFPIFFSHVESFSGLPPAPSSAFVQSPSSATTPGDLSLAASLSVSRLGCSSQATPSLPQKPAKTSVERHLGIFGCRQRCHVGPFPAGLNQGDHNEFHQYHQSSTFSTKRD